MPEHRQTQKKSWRDLSTRPGLRIQILNLLWEKSNPLCRPQPKRSKKTTGGDTQLQHQNTALVPTSNQIVLQNKSLAQLEEETTPPPHLQSCQLLLLFRTSSKTLTNSSIRCFKMLHLPTAPPTGCCKRPVSWEGRKNFSRCTERKFSKMDQNFFNHFMSKNVKEHLTFLDKHHSLLKRPKSGVQPLFCVSADNVKTLNFSSIFTSLPLKKAQSSIGAEGDSGLMRPMFPPPRPMDATPALCQPSTK